MTNKQEATFSATLMGDFDEGSLLLKIETNEIVTDLLKQCCLKPDHEKFKLVSAETYSFKKFDRYMIKKLMFDKLTDNDYVEVMFSKQLLENGVASYVLTQNIDVTQFLERCKKSIETIHKQLSSLNKKSSLKIEMES